MKINEFLKSVPFCKCIRNKNFSLNFFNLGVKDIHEYVVLISCDQSGGRGIHILLQGWRVSREGLNVLMQYLNSPLNKKLQHIHQRAK